MVFGSVFLFYTLPADGEEHIAYPSSVVYAASSSASISPTTSGICMKLSVTPDNTGDDLEQQPEACAQTLRTKFSHSSYPVSATANKGFIDIIVFSSSPSDIHEVKEFLTIKGKLSIHLVHRQTRTLAAEIASNQKIIPSYKALPHINKDPATGATTSEQVLIRIKAELSGKEMKAAYLDQRDPSIINIELTDAGGKKMEAFTLSLTKNVDKIATVFDGKVINYATLNAKTLGRRFIITGLESKEAVNLCRSLQSPLTSTLKIIEQRPYSP